MCGLLAKDTLIARKKTPNLAQVSVITVSPYLEMRKLLANEGFLKAKINSVFLQLALLNMSIMLSSLAFAITVNIFVWHFAQLQGIKVPAPKKLPIQELKLERENSMTLLVSGAELSSHPCIAR